MASLVSVIVPTIREGYLQKCISYFDNQTYQERELIIVPGGGSIGEKRNRGCEAANGDIIVHFDDDDYYSPDYIENAVIHLIETNSILTGLSSAYFYDKKNRKAWLWQYTGGMPYVCEASMVYYKSFWQEKPFRDTSIGEGIGFLEYRKGVSPHNHINSFVANIHDSNTASKQQLRNMKNIRPEIVENILNL